MKRKVPYLQYEILEYYYINSNSTLSEYVGYSERSLILQSAIKKLIDKKFLTEDFQLTLESKQLVKRHKNIRYNFPDYKNTNFKQPKQTQLPINTINNNVNNVNKNGIVFRWYKYLEDFSHSFIIEKINKYKLDNKFYILDPFTGSGTTQIQSKFYGFKSLGIDINPVMVFIAKNKLNWKIDPLKLKKIAEEIIHQFKRASEEDKFNAIKDTNLNNMPKKELKQWLSPVKQAEVSFMLKLIKRVENLSLRNLLWFITSTSALNSSYVAFCPGTTFYPFRERPNFLDEFIKLTNWVIEDLDNSEVIKNKNVQSDVILGSTKNIQNLNKYLNKIDLIITSPPYPNDLEYSRQTRLELYLFDFVKNMNDVRNLKKQMIKGSTKLIFKEDKALSKIKEIKSIKKIVKELSEKLKNKDWGFDYPKMIEQYFSDMWECLEVYHNIMVTGGACILVIGDQTFKGIVIPVGKILEEIGKKIGFKKSIIELHRHRRSTTHSIPIPEENLILIK